MFSALHEFGQAYARMVVSSLPKGDLVQEGSVGLLQAAIRFDPERDIHFPPTRRRGSLRRFPDFISRNWSIVRTGTTAAQKSLFFNPCRLRARIADIPGRCTGQS
jgi:RNA polymerase sigma-32 factor